MIIIHFNKEQLHVEQDMSIDKLLVQLDQSPNGIAVAVNSEVVPKRNWQSIKLKNKDVVLMIKATQGG